MNLSIPQDAFSDGQVRSKLWLANSLNEWSEKYFDLNESYTLTWYGSWVGVGPFLLLSLSKIKFETVNLIELDETLLQTSKRVLDHWRINGTKINTLYSDMNAYDPPMDSKHQLFINTACEHVIENQWLEKIPKNSKLLLQSTNMIHDEHVNRATSLQDFKNKVSNHFLIQEESQMDIDYGSMFFSRYMLFGAK